MKKKVLDPALELTPCNEEGKTCPFVTLISGLLTAAVLPVVCSTYLVWWQFHKDRGTSKKQIAARALAREEGNVQ